MAKAAFQERKKMKKSLLGNICSPTSPEKAVHQTAACLVLKTHQLLINSEKGKYKVLSFVLGDITRVFYMSTIICDFEWISISFSIFLHQPTLLECNCPQMSTDESQNYFSTSIQPLVSRTLTHLKILTMCIYGEDVRDVLKGDL